MTGYTYGGSDGALYGTSDGALYADSTVIQSGLIEFRAVRPAGPTVDPDLFDVNPLRDAFGMFKSGATLMFTDADGTKNANYPYGQRVEIQYTTDGGSTWNVRLAGIVHNTERTTKDGLPHLKVMVVAYDHLLRRRKVYKDYSSTARSAILKDLIENFTSVKWVASNVNVADDASVDFPLRGTRVDEAIDQLASESGNEEWGVNNDLEFFFHQQDISRAAPIGDADVIEYDLPKEGRRAINRFKLFYGANGGNFVTVEDREAQKDLKEKLDAPRRVVISGSDTMTEVTTEARAEKIARQRLGKRSVVQTGEIQIPLGRFDTEAGNIIELTISDAGISEADFRIAQIDYQWTRSMVRATIAENVGADISNLLTSLSDSLSNVRSRDADPAATGTDYLEQRSGVTVSPSVRIIKRQIASDAFVPGPNRSVPGANRDVLGQRLDSRSESTSKESAKVTRAGLNMFRDVWQGEAATSITHAAVGDDDTAAVRGDNALQNEVGREDSASVTAGSAAEDIELDSGRINTTGSLSTTTLREWGFFDAASGGNCYHRVTVGDIDLSSLDAIEFESTLTIDTDAEEDGVVTATGQERLRDLWIGETGHEPSDMVYGTGTSEPTESDTSLDSQVHEDAIDSTADKATGITDVIERIGAAEVNGNDIAEIGEENSANELLTRITIEPYPKTSNAAFETNHKFRARNA